MTSAIGVNGGTSRASIVKAVAGIMMIILREKVKQQMSRPPIKAMEAVKRYCEKKNTCKGCPMHYSKKHGYCSCMHRPEHWEITKEGDEK